MGSGRQLRFLYGTNTTDAIARSIVDFMLPVVVVSGLGGAATDVGILNAVSGAGFILLGVPLGYFADKSTTVRALGVSLALKLLAILILIVGVTFGFLNFVVVLAAAGLFGVGIVGAESAQTVAAVRLAGLGSVARVYSKLQSADTAASIAMPVVAGVLLSWSDLGLLAIVVAFLGVALVLALKIHTSPVSIDVSQNSGTESMWVGFREIYSNRALLSITVITILTNLALAVISAVESVLFLKHLGASITQYGVYTGIAAVTALLGSLIATRFIERVGKESTVFLGYGILTVAAALLIVPSVYPTTWGLAAAYTHAGLWGIAMVVANIAMAGWTAEVIPENLLGRTSSAGRSLSMGTIPVGGIMGGLLADHIGLTFTLILTSTLVGGSFLLSWTLKRPKTTTI